MTIDPLITYLVPVLAFVAGAIFNGWAERRRQRDSERDRISLELLAQRRELYPEILVSANRALETAHEIFDDIADVQDDLDSAKALPDSDEAKRERLQKCVDAWATVQSAFPSHVENFNGFTDAIFRAEVVSTNEVAEVLREINETMERFVAALPDSAEGGYGAKARPILHALKEDRARLTRKLTEAMRRELGVDVLATRLQIFVPMAVSGIAKKTGAPRALGK